MKTNTPPNQQHDLGLNLSLLRGLACAVLLSTIAMSEAAIIVNDTWKDSTRTDPAQPVYTEAGTDADADGDIEAAWYRSGTGSSTTMSSNHMVHAAGAAASMSLTTYFAVSNGAVSLNAVGDKITITWVFKPNGVTTTGTGNADMRIAIVDSTARVVSDATPFNTNYTGYGIFMNMRAGTLGNAAPLRSMEWAGGANNILSTAGAWAFNASASATVGTTPGYTSGNTYTLVWSATKTSTGADIYQGITDSGGTLDGDGLLEVTYSDPSPQPLVFDTFSLRPGTPEATATNFDTTLFKVEFTPAACAPTSFHVTGGGQVCSGGTALVGLSNSVVGVDYHLLVGGSATGTLLPGTGAALDFGLQGVGTYTVYASNTTIACEGLMTGSAIVSQYADPVVTVDPAPANAVNAVGDTRVFSVTATGPGLTYQWRKDGGNLSNGGNIAGATTTTLTLNNLTLGDSGAYDCVVSNSPCGAFTTSAAANLTVSAGSGILFRSVNTGPANWSDPATWEQSNNGTTWAAATQAPTSLDSNIVVQAGHTVVVDSDQTADELTIQAGGTLSVQGGSLTINNAVGIDVNVLGTLEVGAGAGTILQGTASIQFGNGGEFNWNRTAAPAIPTATWLDGSTCRISGTAGSNVFATGVSGQSFYDLIYDTTTAGQSARCRLDIQGTATTVRRDLTITLPDTHNASVTLNNGASTVLTVGRHVTFTTGTTTNSNKVLLHNAAPLSDFRFKIGGNLASVGFLDGFGGGSTVFFELNGTGSQSVSVPLSPALQNRDAMNWVVNGGSTAALASDLDGFNTFTNKGTLNFGTKTIITGNTLVFDAGCTVIGNGTNQLTSTNLDAIVVGGTLSLPGLPAFVGGETFLLFGADAHSGTFASISPPTPGVGLVWDATQLGSAGILAVTTPGGSPSNSPTNIVSSVSGSTLTLSWPESHKGWTLQTQTNSRSVGLTTNSWFDVSGSSATNQVDITINKNDPTVFFRLRLPQP